MTTKYKVLRVFMLIGLTISCVGFSPHLASAIQAPPVSSCTNYNGTCATCESDSSNCTSDSPDPAATTCDQNSCDLIKNYINPLIALLSGLVGLVAVISLIMGGIQYSSSAGDPQKAAKAKGRIVNTIIALLAYIFLFAFLEFLLPGGLLHSAG